MKNNLKNKIFSIILILLIIILLWIIYNKKYENFQNQEDNQNNNQYLYPIKKLQPICKKEGLKASYMPKACYVDGVMNSYANCKCEDEKGNCKICYPTIERDTKNSSVIYAPNWS